MRIPSADGFGQVIAQPAMHDRRQPVPNVADGIGRFTSQLLSEERATADAADRANAVGAVNTGRDSMAAAHDEITEGVRTGAISKEEAANVWAQRANEIRSTALEGVPERYRGNAQNDLDSQNARFTRGIGKAVTQRNQADVRQGLESTFESSQRLYMTNPGAANEVVEAAILELGPHSGMAPDQLAKARQGWMENTRFAKASELITGARRDNAALGQVEKQLTGDEFGSLDPQRRVQLMTQIEGFKVSNDQRAEADVRRRQAEEERRLRQAESQFNAATSIINTGKVLSPAYVDQVTAAVVGTPYEGAFKEFARDGAANVAFGSQPLTTQTALLNKARANLNVTGTTPEAEKRLNQLQRINDQAVKDYAEDPLIAAQERGVLSAVAPLNTSSPAAMISTIGERLNQAEIVSQQTGAPVSPLTKAEAEQAGRMINTLPTEQRSTAIAQLAETVGPAQAAALGKQMAPKDKALGIALGMAGARTTQGRYTSEIVLKGAQAIKDRAVKEDNAALTGIRARVAAEIGDAYPNQELRQTMIDAAVYAEYGLQSEGSGNPANAVRLVTGGITDRGGKKTPLPYGVTPKEFETKLGQLTPDTIKAQVPDGKVYVSGTAMESADFLKQVPKAALIHAGNGRYAVQSGQGLATNAQGRPLIIEVK